MSGILINPAYAPGDVPAPSREAAVFHRALPGYRPTPVHDLPALAAEAGVAAVALKDESDRVATALRERLGDPPSFVAFEGYDTVAVLADVLRSHDADRPRTAEPWPGVAVEGTRGQVQFSRVPGISVWQWAWAPIQVVDRDPSQPDRFRVLHAG